MRWWIGPILGTFLLLGGLFACQDDGTPAPDGDETASDGDTDPTDPTDLPDGDEPDGEASDGDEVVTPADCLEDCRAHCAQAGECYSHIGAPEVASCNANCEARSGDTALFGCRRETDCAAFRACREGGGVATYLCAWPQPGTEPVGTP